MGWQAWLDSTNGTPVAAAARATAKSASAPRRAAAPTGASSSGLACRVPNSSTDRSRSTAPAAIRGTTAHRSNASRLRRIVRPSPAPPATYAQARALLARRAARSRAAAPVGTRGRRPSTPAR